MMYNESYDTSEVLDRNMYSNYIIYSTDFLLHILHGCHSLKKTELGQKIINTCMDIIIIYSSTWQFHPEASYSIKLFETVAHIVLFHSTCSIVTYVYIILSRLTEQYENMKNIIWFLITLSNVNTSC